MSSKIKITEESLLYLNRKLLEYVYDNDEEKIDFSMICYLGLNSTIGGKFEFEECLVDECDIERKIVDIKNMLKNANNFFCTDFCPAFISKKGLLGESSINVIGISISSGFDLEETFRHELVHAILNTKDKDSRKYKDFVYSIAKKIDRNNCEGLSVYCAKNLYDFKISNNFKYGEEVVAEVLSLKKADPELAKYAGICFDDFRNDSLCWSDLSLI